MGGGYRVWWDGWKGVESRDNLTICSLPPPMYSELMTKADDANKSVLVGRAIACQQPVWTAPATGNDGGNRDCETARISPELSLLASVLRTG